MYVHGISVQVPNPPGGECRVSVSMGHVYHVYLDFLRSISYPRVNFIHKFIPAKVRPFPTGLGHTPRDLQFLDVIGAFLKSFS